MNERSRELERINSGGFEFDRAAAARSRSCSLLSTTSTVTGHCPFIFVLTTELDQTLIFACTYPFNCRRESNKHVYHTNLPPTCVLTNYETNIYDSKTSKP